MNLSDVKAKTTPELAELASSFSIDEANCMRRQDLIFAILRAQSSERGNTITGEGVLEVLPDGFGFLRAPDANYLPGADDIYVSPSQIRRFNLRTGDTVSGQIRAPKESERYFALLKVERINHSAPDDQPQRIPFDELTPLYPREQLRLERSPETMSPRVLDLFCPIGKGQRSLIVSPPRTGKTSLLRDIAGGIAGNHPEVELLVLLIDERPEEVTEMKRAIDGGEVISSTFDEPASRHVQVAEIVIEKARRLAENGVDVVILLDSISRLARAYNAVAPATSNVDTNALHKPKRFFGAARKLEEGGSLTIVATALVQTGVRSDEVILEELAGTANSEIYLDRALLDRRIFPCIDLYRSTTRKDELLLGVERSGRLWRLRDELLGSRDPVAAMQQLRERLAATSSNDEFVQAIAA